MITSSDDLCNLFRHLCNVICTGTLKLRKISVSIQDTDHLDPILFCTVDIIISVTDHNDLIVILPFHAQVIQRIPDHIRLPDQRAIHRSPVNPCKIFCKIKFVRNPFCILFRFGSRHCKYISFIFQGFQRLRKPFIHRILKNAFHRIIFPVILYSIQTLLFCKTVKDEFDLIYYNGPIYIL